MKTKQTKAPKSSKFDEADLVERIEIKLDKSEEEKLIHWIDEHKSMIELARTAFRDRYIRYLYNWDDFVTYIRKGPWHNSSQLHMPLTAIMCKSFISRLYNIFSDEGATQLVPRETSDENYVALMKRLRTWYLFDHLNGYTGVRHFAREVFTDQATIGFGIGMKDWQVIQRKVIEVEANELSREMEDLGPQIQESKGEMLQTEEEMETSRVNVKPYKEVQKILTVYEGTRLQSVGFENAFFPNFIPGSSDLDFPPCVVIESQIPVSEVMLKAARGEWDKKKAEAVRDFGAMPETDTAADVRGRKGQLSGYDDSGYYGLKDTRTIQYAFCHYDIDDDGIDEEIVVTKCQNVILKTTFLDRISPSGMRPLFKFDCFSKPRQAYSRGVPEFMYSLNQEMDQHHNMRIDYLSLQTCPFGVYRAASSLKNQPIEVAPGKFIPVDDVTGDIKILNFSTNAQALSGEEDRTWSYAERLISISPLSQGMVPETVGPTRSTSGVVALLRQMDKEFKIIVDQCALQWKKMERMVLDDLDFRVHPAIKLRVLGATAQEALEPKRLQGAENLLSINANFDMRINVAEVVTSEEIQRSNAEMILNKLAAPSLAQQMGVVRAKGIHKAYSDWLATFGKDPKAYIDPPTVLDQPLTLFQEIQVCAQGEMPPMAMQDNHEQKAADLAAFVQTPEFAEAQALQIYAPVTVQAIMRAAQKHLSLAEALRPQGMPNPMGQNGADQGELQTGRAPQQGGENPKKTTSRELPEEGPPKEARTTADEAAAV